MFEKLKELALLLHFLELSLKKAFRSSSSSSTSSSSGSRPLRTEAEELCWWLLDVPSSKILHAARYWRPSAAYLSSARNESFLQWSPSILNAVHPLSTRSYFSSAWIVFGSWHHHAHPLVPAATVWPLLDRIETVHWITWYVRTKKLRLFCASIRYCNHTLRQVEIAPVLSSPFAL